MHYYSFNVADYRKDTTHLTPIEHYIYRTLIDWYYLDEIPIPLDTQLVLRKLGLSKQYEDNLINIVNEFFILTDFGYKHTRIESDIAKFLQNAEKNKENGKKGGRPKTQSVTNGIPMATQLKGNQELITINQEPLAIENTKSKKKTSLPKDFTISERVVIWAQKEGYRNLQKHFDNFVLSAQSNGYTYSDWDSAFMRAIRDNWAKVSSGKLELSL
ncbi:MAG: YdaU family protein [Fluviibacter sp.]